MPLSQEVSLLIQKCTTTASLRKARQLHARILISTPLTSKSPYLYNNLLSMYSKCGSLADAHLLFDEMPHRTIVSYNALISAYCRVPQHAHWPFQLLSRLQTENLRPTGATFTGLLQASSCLEDVVVGSELHSQALKSGFSNDVSVQTCLLEMYSSCGELDWSKKVFVDMVDKDATAYNCLVHGYMKNEKSMEGLCQFGSMLRDGTFPTQFTYSMVFNACGRLQRDDIGRLVHGKLVVSGTSTDLPLQNALLDMYCSFDDIQTAMSVFSEIENPDLVSWNSMLSGFSEIGYVEKVLDIYLQLCRDTFVKPDGYTFAIVISAIRALPGCSYGKPLHAQINKAGFQESLYVGSTLVSMYFSNGESESAQKIFDSMWKKDIVLWTDMITGHARMGDGENAMKCFHGMLRDGHKVDSFALSIALSACADLATKKQGEMIHCQASKLGYDLEMNVCGSLIDMYAKIGDLQAAELILAQPDSPDLKCWNSMLGGYGHHGKAKEAFIVFDEILRRGLTPDQVTFLSLLAACNHCGLVDKGKALWNSMKENNLTPGPKHYSSMVGLLSRAGYLEEAERMIIESRLGDHHLELWRTLLSSCVSRRNAEIGRRAAEKIWSIDAEDIAAYVLLTNLYAATGRWDIVAEMRKKIRGLALEKDPGLSWIEVLNDTHVFYSGDQSHAEADKVQAELHRLQRNLAKQEDYCI